MAIPPITVTAGVNGLATRAGYEGTTSLPKTFYLTLTQDADNNTSAYNYTNVAMAKGDGNNATTYTPEKEMLWIDGTSCDPFVSAYTTDETTFTVQADQSTAENVLASDLLGAVKTDGEKSDITISGNNIAVNFRHLLCKLDLTYKWNREIADATSKTIDNVTISGMNMKVALDRETSAVSYASTVGDIKAYVTDITGGNYLSEAIFAPSTAAPEVTITATVDDKQRIFKAILSTPDGGFTSGNCYSATLTIGKDVATVSAVSVSAFTDAEINPDDGETEQTTSLVLDASNMSVADLKTAVAKALTATASTHVLDITLASDADAEMFTAIRRAICDANGVTDGSIALTLSGVTAIPGQSDKATKGNAIFGKVLMDENGKSLKEAECVTGLKSITLPDATSIDMCSFESCGNLAEIVAPKVTIVSTYAFADCGLVSVELPEATTLGALAFFDCKGLTTIKLPKVTSLGNQALDAYTRDSELTIYLTSDSDITVNKNCFKWLVNKSLLSTKVNLVLNANKATQVNANTWTPSEGVSFTFKTISFAE